VEPVSFNDGLSEQLERRSHESAKLSENENRPSPSEQNNNVRNMKSVPPLPRSLSAELPRKENSNVIPHVISNLSHQGK